MYIFECALQNSPACALTRAHGPGAWAGELTGLTTRTSGGGRRPVAMEATNSRAAADTNASDMPPRPWGVPVEITTSCPASSTAGAPVPNGATLLKSLGRFSPDCGPRFQVKSDTYNAIRLSKHQRYSTNSTTEHARTRWLDKQHNQRGKTSAPPSSATSTGSTSRQPADELSSSHRAGATIRAARVGLAARSAACSTARWSGCPAALPRTAPRCS